MTINCTHSKMTNHMIMTLLVTSTAVPNFPESVDGFSLQQIMFFFFLLEKKKKGKKNHINLMHSWVSWPC